jgi:hypothetical protein
MNRETVGTVVSVKKQWWLKVNTKPIRSGTLDGAVFPYVIKVRYYVDGCEFSKRKWIRAGAPVPNMGSLVKVIYSESNPKKAKLL